MTSKSWLYMSKGSTPIPIIIVKMYYFMDYDVTHYMEVKGDGSLTPVKEVVSRKGGFPEFGVNCGGKFPEIKTKYCYSCGAIALKEIIKTFVVMDNSPMEEMEILGVFSSKEKAEEFVNHISNLHEAPKENYPIFEKEIDMKFKR